MRVISEQEKADILAIPRNLSHGLPFRNARKMFLCLTRNIAAGTLIGNSCQKKGYEKSIKTQLVAECIPIHIIGKIEAFPIFCDDYEILAPCR